MRGRLMFLLCVGAVGALGLVPAGAATRTSVMQDCIFKPSFRAVDVGDRVIWSYDENTGDPCVGQNHRVETFGSPPERFDSSPGCDSSFSPDLSCMNDAPKRRTYSKTFTKPGTYDYFCRFHGTPSGDPTKGECGMCGRIVVNVATSSPSPTASATPTRSATPTASPSPSVSPSVSPSASPSGTASPSPSPTGTLVADGPRTGDGGGPGRGTIALAAVVALGAAAFYVWRALIVQR